MNIVRLDGTTKPNGACNYTRLWSITVKVSKEELNTQVLTKCVEERLRQENMNDAIVITDALGTVFADSATADDLSSPSKRVLAASVKNYEKHVGSAKIMLADEMSFTPPKKQARVWTRGRSHVLAREISPRRSSTTSSSSRRRLKSSSSRPRT